MTTQKFVLSFPVEATHRPVVYDLIRNYDIRINILKAEIEIGKNGKLLVEMEADERKLEKSLAYLAENGIMVSLLANKISYQKEQCVNCGSCASSCISQALTINAPDWKLCFEPEKCIACRLCIKSCPMQLFTLDFTD